MTMTKESRVTPICAACLADLEAAGYRPREVTRQSESFVVLPAAPRMRRCGICSKKAECTDCVIWNRKGGMAR